MIEFELKQERILQLLARRNLDGVLLRRVSSFAWATCGAASYVNTAVSEGAAALLITRHERAVLTNNIEAPRLELQERLPELGWEVRAEPWWQAAEHGLELALRMRLGSDVAMAGAEDLSLDLARLRARLTEEERQRFRQLGRLCAEAMGETMRSIEPGQTEHQISARLASETLSRGVLPIVNLVATDENVYRFRHPLPTGKRLDRYAMVVLCGRRWGLVCSMTRLVHFGDLPPELRERAEAVAHVDARLIEATRPGRTLDQVFRLGVEAYAEAGFPNEWKLHHQGGLAGYEPRELLATPDSEEPVEAGQAYAWNPSVSGCKSEDTILVQPMGVEILTRIDGWPNVSRALAEPRPAVLERG